MPKHYVILSDIHANWLALKAVLRDVVTYSAEAGIGIDGYVCLGDIVGYGAHPTACVLAVQRLKPVVWLKGNHERILFQDEHEGEIAGNGADEEAKKTGQWGRVRLEKYGKGVCLEHLRHLRELVIAPSGIENVTFVHGNLRNPLWGKITSVELARSQLSVLQTQICFYGHIHRCQLIRLHPGLEDEDKFYRTGSLKEGTPYGYGQWIEMAEPFRWFVCAGSIGQPRDRDPRAGYVLLRRDGDTTHVQFRRVTYPWRSAQWLMDNKGWGSLAPQSRNRLERGI